MLPPAILDLAKARSHGLFCRKQVYRRGFTDGSISTWLGGGHIERLAPGWYRMAGVEAPADQCLHLPVEYMRHKGGRPVVLTGRAGLAAHGVGSVALPLNPLVLIDRGYQVRVKDAPWTARQTKLADVESSRAEGLPVAHPARCLADAATEGVNGKVLDEDALLGLCFDTLNAARLSPASLRGRWETMAQHSGAARLLDLSARGELDVESHGERWVLRRVFGDRPPAPDCQVTVAPGRRADFVFVYAGLIIEYYGREAHEGRVDEDATRVHELRALGFDVYVLTRTIVRRDPEGAARTIHAIRRQREKLIMAGELPRPALPVQRNRRTPLRTAVPLG